MSSMELMLILRVLALCELVSISVVIPTDFLLDGNSQVGTSDIHLLPNNNRL